MEMKGMTKLTDLQSRLQDCIDGIIRNVEWDKIYKAMVCIDWTWARYGRTPTVDELKKQARNMLEEVASTALINKSDWFIGCGGIEVRARYLEDDESAWSLEFKFVLDSWEDEV